jgi:dCMP deaminase
VTDDRMGLDEYFMRVAFLVSRRSTCLRRRVGAIVVKQKRILTTGYNGAPRNIAHCLEVGCLREQMGIRPGERHELCRGVHAEQNAIIQSAVFGVPIEGGTLYSTTFPCVLCSKLIINAGLREIVYAKGYPDELSKQMLEESGILLRQVPPPGGVEESDVPEDGRDHAVD